MGRTVLVFTEEHAERHRRSLERLRPSEAKLRAYCEAFSEVTFGTAGEGMAGYLRILRKALRETESGRAVVIPLVD